MPMGEMCPNTVWLMLVAPPGSGDYSLEASGDLVKEGQFVLAAYRFNSNVQMSVNGASSPLVHKLD